MQRNREEEKRERDEEKEEKETHTKRKRKRHSDEREAHTNERERPRQRDADRERCRETENERDHKNREKKRKDELQQREREREREASNHLRSIALREASTAAVVLSRLTGSMRSLSTAPCRLFSRDLSSPNPLSFSSPTAVSRYRIAPPCPPCFGFFFALFGCVMYLTSVW